MKDNKIIGYAVVATISDSLKPDKLGEKEYGRGILKVIPLYKNTDIILSPGTVVRSVSLAPLSNTQVTVSSE